MHNVHSKGDPLPRIALTVIAVTLGFAALRQGADIFAPIVLALVTGVMLAPLTDLLERAGLPDRFASAVVLILGVTAIALLLVLAEPVIWRISEALPRIKWELRTFVAEFRGLIRGLIEVNREVEEALGAEPGQAKEAAEAVMPSLTSAVFLAPVLIAKVLIFAGTLYFFLLTRKGVYAWLAHWIGTRADTAVIMERFTTVERLVARYFLTISVINALMGVALGAALMLIGLPGPLLWGLAAALLNFILYLGPVVMVGGLFFAGLVAFDGLMSFAPPAIFLALNMIEAQFVTPSFVGRHISVNPLLVFISLVIWLWLWGPVGGIVAIPVLVTALVMLNIFEHEDAGAPEDSQGAA